MSSSRSLQGVLLCLAAYGLFGIQDAAIKWLVAERTVYESLFWRCLTVLLVVLLIGRGRLLHEVARSSVRGGVLWRALISLVAWVLYYSGGRELSLAQMTTLYFSAPIVVTLLAVWLLGERANATQWGSVFLGFAGIVVACRPGRLEAPLATLMVLIAAVLWAYGYILLRRFSGRMSVSGQMLLTNLVAVVLLGISLPWTWTAVDLTQVLAMGSVGLAGGLAQYLLFASFERAEASVLAPFEYSGLLWAFMLSWLIWDVRPDAALWVGAGMIACSGLIGTWVAIRRPKFSAA